MKKKKNQRTINGVTFDRFSCSKTRTAAAKKAKAKRKSGNFYARVVKNGNHFCVYTRKKAGKLKGSGKKPRQ